MDPMDVDVAVVGGGISGLATAYHLSKTMPDHLKVCVLEAKERIGGRTYSVKVDNPASDGHEDTLDLGGHWISDRQKDIMELAREFGIEYYDQNVNGTKVTQLGPKGTIRTYESEIPNYGTYIGLLQLQSLISKFEKMTAKVDITDPYNSCPEAVKWDSMTLDTFIRSCVSYEVIVETMNAAMVASLGCDCSQISLLFFLAYANSAGGVMKLLLVEDGAAQQYKIKGGAQEFSKKMALSIGEEKVFCNHAVTSIILNETGAEMICDNGQIVNAKRVVLAAPPNQISAIEFSPELPFPKRDILEAMPMASIRKTYAIYKTSFWLDKGFSGELVGNGGVNDRVPCKQGPVGIFYDSTTSSGLPALVGFIAGKVGDQWMEASKEDLKEAIIQQVVECFGKEGSDPVDVIVHDWKSEAFIKGGPCNIMPPGRMHNFQHLRQPWKQTVHFAGTALATSWCGYMSGAVQSGYRAAAEIIKDLAPDKLTQEDKDNLAKAYPGPDCKPVVHEQGDVKSLCSIS